MVTVVEMEAIVITGNLIGSRSKMYGNFDVWFEQRIQALNQALFEELNIERTYTRSQGDAFQIFIPASENFSHLLFLTFYYMRPASIQLGIAIGQYDGHLVQNSWDMYGEIFRSSKQALNTIRTEQNNVIALRTSHCIPEIADDYLRYMLLIMNTWKPDTWDDIYWFVTGENIQACATARDVSQDGFYKRLQRSGCRRLFHSLDLLIGKNN